MAAESKVRKQARRSTSSIASEGFPDEFPPPELMTRTAVYKRVPVAVRYRLDEAILHRGGDRASLDRIAAEFRLSERYRVSVSSLRNYARKLEQFVRPAVMSQLVAGLMGCLPAEYRDQLLAGSQVLLLSRVVRALTATVPESKAQSVPECSPLSVADLAKLASVLAALAAKGTSSRSARKPVPRKESDDAGGPIASDSKGLSAAVRAVYGLDWPARSGQ